MIKFNYIELFNLPNMQPCLDNIDIAYYDLLMNGSEFSRVLNIYNINLFMC